MSTSVTETLPALSLQPFVKAYWSGVFNTDAAARYHQSVVPNGCIEIIIHLSADHCSLIGNKDEWSRSPEFTLIGIHPRPYEVRFATRVEVFGIRLFPEGIQQVFGIPPAEFVATYEAGEDVLGIRFRDFCQKIRESRSAMRPQLANMFLEKELISNCIQTDYADEAIRIIRKTSGLVPVREVTRQIPISTRQLQRAFKTRFGLSLSDYLRITRINAVQKYMLSSSSHKLTNLSYDLDFSDQSHFIREFKYYVGTSPTKFLKNKPAYIVNPG